MHLIQVVLVADNDERAEDALRSEFELWGVYEVLPWEDKGLNDLLSYASRFIPAGRWLELNAKCPGGAYFAPAFAFNNLARIDFGTLSALLPNWNRYRALGPNFFTTERGGRLRRQVPNGPDPAWVIYKPDGQPPTHGPGEYLLKCSFVNNWHALLFSFDDNYIQLY